MYLWSHEAERGQEEGSKERPVVVVLATEQGESGLKVTVAPLTTKAPSPGDWAVEVPAAVRTHLKLGDARCWIVVSEFNRFEWPGPDLRAARRTGDTSPYYGKIPARLFEALREKMRLLGAGRLRVLARNE